MGSENGWLEGNEFVLLAEDDFSFLVQTTDARLYHHKSCINQDCW
jgi:hypothetical protein